MIEISPRAQKVLSQVQLNARDDITLIAKRLRMRPHSVRYELQLLIDRGLLYPYMLINHFALGLQEVAFLCSLANRKEGDIDRLAKALKPFPGLFVLNLTGGDYQLDFSILVKELTEAQTFLENLSSQHGLRMGGKESAISLNWRLYHRKYMSQISPRIASIVTEPKGALVSLDDLDRKILLTLGRKPLVSMRELSRELGIPESTAKFRFNRLIESGVILGFGLSLDGSEVGMFSYELFITLKDHSPTVKKKLNQFCDAHPHILSVSHWLGSWDISLRCEVFRPSDAFRIADEIELLLGPAAGRIQSAPLLKEVNVQRDIINW